MGIILPLEKKASANDMSFADKVRVGVLASILVANLSAAEGISAVGPSAVSA